MDNSKIITKNANLIAYKIKKLRTQYLKCSQFKFAYDTGFHQTYISKVEQGKVPITVKLIDSICLNLHVNPEYFYGDVEVPFLDRNESLEEHILKKLQRLEEGFLKLDSKNQQIVLDMIEMLLTKNH